MQQGLELVFLGMGTVFIFLIVLIVCTTIMSKAVMAFTKNQPQPDTTKPISNSQGLPEPVLAAVITAAIHQHRASKSK
ncbi:MAG: oxaloacetate decarboxylase gamma chain [Gammaproteobacteria bacterium]|nr:MAG: oxaloacetate decarboxylase gamma chain [Gammaproteobacteria bacterium]